jgi:cell division protein FtsB
MVIFGEQGLLVLSETEERLSEARIDAGQLGNKNKELRLKVRKLKSRPEEVEILAGKIFNQAKDGSTLYVFSSEE